MKRDSLKQFIKQRQALSQEKAALEARLHQLNQALDVTSSAPAPAAQPAGKRARWIMSPAARAKIAAAQRARWAKVKRSPEATVAAKVAKSPTRKISAAGRASISAAAKARWAKVKAAGKNRL